MKRTAQGIEEHKAAVSAEGSRKAKGTGRGNHPNSRKNLRPKPWPKGISGNPGGLPGTDLAALHARRLFEQYGADKQGFESLGAELKGFNAYAFSVLADRGYGKIKERVEYTGADGEPLSINVTFVKAG